MNSEGELNKDVAEMRSALLERYSRIYKRDLSTVTSFSADAKGRSVNTPGKRSVIKDAPQSAQTISARIVPEKNSLRERLDSYWFYFKKAAYEKGTSEAIRIAYRYVFRKGNEPERSIPQQVQEAPKPYSHLDAAAFPSLQAHSSYPLLSFPKFDDPQVSIIIPVYNQWNYTYFCLKSILETCRQTTYEIIVGDDCSSDKTAELEKYAENVIHIRNPENLRFLRNCNNASKYARGKYLVFLNNDTVVMEGWLDSLVKLIESRDDVGMVGSKFLYPDGTLQEAGGIVWSNGDGLNYGRGNDPSDYKYNYVREVDYISGASILIPRSLWNEIGGFDPRYTPAYFEDSDLAFEIRKRGLKVLYQPRSELVHFERTSSGDSAWALMKNNKVKFLEKWGDVLRTDSFFPNGPADVQRGRSKWRKSVLLIDDMPIHFDENAGSKTIFNFLQLFIGLGYDVTFLNDSCWGYDGKYTDILQQMGVEVVYGNKYWHNQTDWMDKNAGRFDLVLLSRPNIGMKYLDRFKHEPNCKIAYYGHDLHYVREMREYELTGNKELLDRSVNHKIEELHLHEEADISLVVSSDEKRIVDGELGTARTVVTPIFFYKNIPYKEPDFDRKNGLLFVGGFDHTPNVDGILWFVKEILPLVRKRIPGIKLTIAGSNPKKKILDLAGKDITVTGYLPDDELDKLYDASLISIVPVRFGAGVKGKTVDAMHHKMAVVSTSIGLEGLPGINDCIRPHDTPEEFADEIVRLCSDKDAVRKESRANYSYVMNRFSYDAALDLFRSVFGDGHKEKHRPIRILDIVYYMACPPKSGGALRVISPLEKMDADCGLEFDIVFSNGARENISRCEQYLNNIPAVGFAKGILTDQYLNNINGKPNDIPEDVWNTMSMELMDYLRELVTQIHYDIIQIEHSQLSWIVPELRTLSPESIFVLDSHNIEYRKFETWMPYAKPDEAQHISEQLSEMKAWEERVWQWYDAAISISAEECGILKSGGLRRVATVPTGGGVDLNKYAPEKMIEKPIDILYIGTMNWYPNAHGLRWFIEKVIPLIERERPGTVFHVVGSGKPETEFLNTLKADVPVKFWSFQRDDAWFLHRAKVFVIPLWIGAGARVKLITAWGAGTPVVSTTFGAEGSDARDGENILLADDPQAFADSVLRLLNDRKYGENIAHAAFETVREKYTVERCADMLIGFYRDLAKKD